MKRTIFEVRLNLLLQKVQVTVLNVLQLVFCNKCSLYGKSFLAENNFFLYSKQTKIFFNATPIHTKSIWKNISWKTHFISKSCISWRVRVFATSSSCLMFSSLRLASAGLRSIVAGGVSSDSDGCCTTIVAWAVLSTPVVFPAPLCEKKNFFKLKEKD